MEYKKYSGEFQKNNIIQNLKVFHNRIKKFFIDNYLTNSKMLIDIGSGRGSDAQYWFKNKVKFAIGIEPSEESIKKAIQNYNRLKKIAEDGTKIVYLNGVGNKIWADGSAALRSQDVSKFKYFFGEKKVKAQNINLFWTIHYMMNSQKDFENLLTNISSHSSNNCYVVILCMDGAKVDNLFKYYGQQYQITKNGNTIFKIEANYDFNKKISELNKYGNKILVTLKSTYGLEKGIEENLVFKELIMDEFSKIGFKLITMKRFLDIDIPEREKLADYEEKISDLYVSLVFQKI